MKNETVYMYVRETKKQTRKSIIVIIFIFTMPNSKTKINVDIKYIK